MNAYVICVWLHVIAAATWVGSMVFFAAVVVPLLRREELRASAPVLIRLVGARYRIVGWISLATLIVTGIGNLYFRGFAWSLLTNVDFWMQGFGFGRWFVWKLGFVGLVVVLTVLHEIIVIGDPVRARRVASLLGRFLMLISLAIVFFAVAMVRGCT